jgi:drug/metabolite transporter (DMT)-like permease
MLAVLLALGASLFWGLGDLIAGLTARRGPALSVTLLGHIAGATGAALVILALSRGWPGWTALLPAALAGVALPISAGAFFKAMSIGKMSVVGPIGGSGAALPVVVGMLQGERPAILQVVGMAAAMAGIVLASREPEDAKVPVTPGDLLPPEERPRAHPVSAADNRRSIMLAILSAVTYGVLLLGMAGTAQYDPFWPPLVSRTLSVAILSAVIVSRGRGLGLSRRTGAVALGAGLCHVTAVTLFSVASTQGLLSVVALLSSLSAVIVVVVAWLALHERLTGVQRLGVGLTLAGVLAILGG